MKDELPATTSPQRSTSDSTLEQDCKDVSAQHSEDSTRGEKKTRRKPYTKPAFKYERVFETTALSCGKMTSAQLQCKLNTKVS